MRAPGYRMPAEWEPHQATWLSWPHNESTWPGVGVAAIEPTIAAAVAELAQGEAVYINVLDADHAAHVRNLLDPRIAPQRLRFFDFPTNDAWCRDHGAIFVRQDTVTAPLLALNFRYNAWGGKYPPFDLDDQVPVRMATALGIPCRDVDMVLEGGSIDVNGAGCALTTEQCLLNHNRNPSLSRVDIETRLKNHLGLDKVIWLGTGIAGDDTDGHVDDLARFVADDTVLTVVEADPGDENYAPLVENLARLRRSQLPDGRPLRVIPLPMPPRLEHDGQRLPASYANFYVANRAVLLPVFDCETDREAAAVLQRCFPTRRIIELDCRKLVVGLGAFHCLTQQVPSVVAGKSASL